jgi:hypothetical protein
MTMTTPMQRQSTPLSTSEAVEESLPAVKKPRNRKPAEKKAVPRTATLHGLWGKPKLTDGQPEAETTSNTAISEPEDEVLDIIKVHQPLHFKINPSKLAAAIEFVHRTERMITPPRSLPDLVPETPAQLESDAPKTPESKDSQKKRSFQDSPVRRSPRNHSRSKEAVASTEPIVDAKKSHPFFMGKEARMCGT